VTYVGVKVIAWIVPAPTKPLLRQCPTCHGSGSVGN
jgi:hypothetical protein